MAHGLMAHGFDGTRRGGTGLRTRLYGKNSRRRARHSDSGQEVEGWQALDAGQELDAGQWQELVGSP